ncbi:MAG: transglycosylase SLT domain-containing protein [Treponema sp.]|nr:transglycosylase SLT domain-containing protein [Treponema sp.]
MKLSALTAIALTFTLPLAAATLEEEKYIDELLPSLTENVTTEKKTSLDSTKTESKSSKTLTHVGGITVPDQPYAQEMIQKYILSYTSTEYAKKALVETLDKGELYRLYIRQELKKRNMPPALEYLPVVESEYKPLATSRSGARGLWQFMENSIKPFMEKNEWIDERLDPWKSTDAALSKLQDNYKMFGDWPIAIAAYNCGAGAMQRILKKAPEKTFWYIAEKGLLRDQSVQYVPKFLAISELSENGGDYGIQLPEITKSTRFAEFDYVTVKENITMKRLASELRMDYTTLKMLNCALVHECTPPDAPYNIRLPVGMGRGAAIALSTMQRSKPEPQVKDTVITHTVIKGETLYFLSRLYGCSVDDICTKNNIEKNDVLSIGKTLYIPVKKAET